MFKLTAGIPGSELPVDSDLGLIAFLFQGLDFPFQNGFVRDAAVQALPTENTGKAARVSATSCLLVSSKQTLGRLGSGGSS